MDASVSAGTESRPAASPLRIVLAFAAVYVIWGTTFLAIRYAVETIPPFLMMAARCLLAGAALVALSRPSRGAALTPAHWRSAVIAGALFFVGCHGVLADVQQRVPSGLAAVFAATIPLWVPLLVWGAGLSERPSLRVAVGLVAGFAGVALLIHAARDPFAGAMSGRDALLLLFSAFCWAAGTAAVRGMSLPPSPMLSAGLQLLCGGMLLLLLSAVRGELWAFDIGAVSPASLAGLGYLIVFGTLVTFNAYVWLLGVVAPARVATYAFVNPVVAVFVGWAIADEALTPAALIAIAIIVLAVAATVTARR